MRVVSALLAYWMGREPPRLLPKWRPPNKLNDLSFVQLDAARGPSGANQVDERQADLELNLPLMPFVPENEQGHVAKASREGDRGVVKVHSHLRSNFKSAGQHGSLTGRKQAPESSEAKNQDIRKVKDEEFPDLMPDLETEDPPPTQEPLERHETDPSPEGNENERSNESPASNENADTTKVKDETLPDILPDFEGDFDDDEEDPSQKEIQERRKRAMEKEKKEEEAERRKQEMEKANEERKRHPAADTESRREEAERLREIREDMKKDPEAVREEIKKEIREEIEDDIKKELEEELKDEEAEIREEVEAEIEEDLKRDVEAEVKSEVTEKVKKDLAEEGLGHEERMSEIGKQALEDKWFTFVAALIFLFILALILIAVCYYAPRIADETEDDASEPHSGGEQPHEILGYWDGVKFLLLRPVNILLVFVPIGLGVHFYAAKVGHTTAFWINILAIVPEAYLIGIATEEIALMMGDLTGALWNASFGNVVELIFVYLTLREGLITVCEGSIVGSILCNHLLLLGFCFLLGGTAMRRRASASPRKFNFGVELSYDANNALNQAQQLLVASFAVTLPSLFADMQNVTLEHVIVLSRAVSFFIVISYVALVTHQLVSQPIKETGLQSEVTMSSALTILAIATIMCALSSEALVEAVSGFAQESGYSKTFLGVVILPIAGDLTHVSAVYMAMKGKMELATSIALSSSIQIAMVVLPTAVFLGYLMEQPMTLNLRAMHSVCLVVSAVITFAVMVDGKSNWLRGYTLLTTFFMIALIVFFQPDIGG